MKKYKVGYIAGVFDLFHIGHLNLLRNAKKECEHLIVGVLSDELVIHFKKKTPYISEEERREIISAIKYVDEAVLVGVDTIEKMKAWEKYKFDCLFSGDDWRNEASWIEDQEKLQAVGSDIFFLPYTKSTSSTQIKKLINDSQSKGEKKIILFGAGEYGQKAIKYYGKDKIAGVVDNDINKVGNQVDGCTIISVQQLEEYMAEYEVVIAIRNYKAVMEQLKACGIKEFSIFKPNE